MTRRRAALLAVTALGLMPLAAAADEWHAFGGTWSATGSRQTLSTEAGRAAIVHLSGAVVLSSGIAGSGFTAEAIGFDDGNGATTGRAVWTDSRGDRIFSDLRAGPLQTGRTVTGTISGGTGRWAGATGDYSLTWQYVVAGEGDAIQGRSADLRGRIRLGATR
jgi:hypothetical protein